MERFDGIGGRGVFVIKEIQGLVAIGSVRVRVESVGYIEVHTQLKSERAQAWLTWCPDVEQTTHAFLE